MSGEVNRAVVLTLKIVGDPSNSKAAAAVDKQVEETTKKQVAAVGKATDAAEKAYDKQAAEAVKMYSRIMKERERAAAADQKAYDRQAADAQKAYSRIMREQDKNEKSLERLQDKAENYGKKTAKAGVQAAGSVIQVGQGIATLGVLSEETTEGMLKGLVRVQGGFQILHGIVSGYDDITDAMEFYTKATKAQAAAQAILNTTTAAGVATAGASAAGSAAKAGAGVAVGAAAGTAAAGGGAMAAVWGTVAAGATAAKTAVVGVVTAFGAVAAVGTAIALIGQEIGAKLGFWESFTGALTSWHTEAAAGAKVAKDLAASEKRVTAAKEAADLRNKAAADRDSVQRQYQSARETMSGFSSVAGGGKEADVNRRQMEAMQSELAAAKARLASEQARQSASSAQGVHGATTGVETQAQQVAEWQTKIAQAQQQQYQSARAIQETQKQTVQTLREQYGEAVKLVDAAKKQAESAAAQKVGQLTKLEIDRAAKIAEKLKAGGSMSRADEQFAADKGLFQSQAAKQQQERGLSTDKGRLIAEVDAAGSQQVRDAEAKAVEAKTAVTRAEFELLATTEEVNVALADFKQTLESLPAALKAVADMAADKAGVARESVGSTGIADAVVNAGQNAAAAQKELTDAMVASLDSIAAESRAAIEAINSRSARGASIQSATS